MRFKDFLSKHDACLVGVKYAESLNWDITKFWNKCHRGDWMLWLAQKVGVEKRLLVLVEGRCANTVRHLMKDERSVNAVDVCIRYGNGEATDAELTAAHAATYATAYAAADAAAAAYAAAANRQQTADIVRKHIPVEMIIERL